jgi:hypothetical protein
MLSTATLGQGRVGKKKVALGPAGSAFDRHLFRLGGFFLAGDNALDRRGADFFVQTFLPEETVQG